MKKIITILLMTFSFSSAYAIWAGPNGDQDCFGKKSLKILMEELKKNEQ